MKDTGNSIGASIGITRNLGNYESMRIDAWETRQVNDPNNAEEVEAAWKSVWEGIESQVEAQLLSADKEMS